VADSGAEFAVAESRMAESAAVQDQGLPQGFGRKIVKTADLGLRAENVRVAAAEAQRVAARFGGSVLRSEARERNLLAAEEGLLKLYDRAEDVEDALSIQRELTGIRGQVEEVQGRIQYLEQITASSQISVGIRPVAEAPGSPAWNPALVAAKAWNASLRVLQGLANAVITALVFGWWLVPVLLGVLAGWRWWARPPSPDPGP
jgi:hypothetical protein